MKNIEDAVEVLGRHITEVTTVSEWAEKMGYPSEKYFSRKIRDCHGKRPKKLIVEKRLEKIKDCLTEAPNEIYYSIAQKLGFANDVALYKFVNWHTGKSLTELKTECENRV